MRDRIANVLLALFGRFLPDASRYGYVAGGSALQTCIEREWIGYDLALFRRLD